MGIPTAAELSHSVIKLHRIRRSPRCAMALGPAQRVRGALAAITRHVDDYVNRARLPRAA